MTNLSNQIINVQRNLIGNFKMLLESNDEGNKELIQKAIDTNFQLLSELENEPEPPLEDFGGDGFFNTLYNLTFSVDLTLRIKSKGGEMTIMVMPASTDDNFIQPIIVTGIPSELDRQFFDLISQPLSNTIAAIVNLEEQEQSVKASTEKPAPAPAKKSSEPAKKEAKKAPVKKEAIPAPAEGSLFEEPETVAPAQESTDDNEDSLEDEPTAE